MGRPGQKAKLAEFLDRSALKRSAGARSFERGSAYFRDRRVGTIKEAANSVRGVVQGARAYRVQLYAEDGELTGSCTCPLGEDGEFCKHCVALGLSWLDARERGSTAPTRPGRAVVSMRDVRAFLSGQSQQTLVDLLLSAAKTDSRLRRQLSLQAAKQGGKTIDLAAYRSMLQSVIDPGDYVDYASSYGYAQNIDSVIDAIEELLQHDCANEVIDLTEYALQLMEEVMESVDDSDGMAGGILERLQALHHKACRKAQPDPEALARRLFSWQLHSDWDVFHDALDRYASLLGESGLAVYRELAGAQWARVPALDAQSARAESYSSKRFRITHVMESLAERSGDIDAIIAVKSRDLSSATSYLGIAEICRKAGRNDAALEWAERGLRAHPHRTDPRLREFLGQEYQRRRQHDDALSIMWDAFTETSSLREYQNLKRYSHRIGTWPGWRERALEHLRQQIAAARRARPNDRRFGFGDHSELVRIFLWERSVEAAWTEARAGGCSTDLWLVLAAKREKSHPEEVLPIYQARIEPILAGKHQRAYLEAVDLLRTIQRIMARLGQQTDFARYLHSLRVRHKPKRNFMKLLDHAFRA